MTTQIQPEAAETAELEIIHLWQTLSPEHRQMLLEVARVFSIVDQPPANGPEEQEPAQPDDEAARRAEQIRKNQGAIAWLQAQIDEYEQATPEERAEAEIEWEDFKRSMNENRRPLPPLFP